MMRVLQFTIIIAFSLFITSCAMQTASYETAKLNYVHGDYARAFQQLWFPARQNDARALYAMGYMYYYGVGTDQDQDLGRSLIRRASDMKYPPAIVAMRLITQARHNQYVPLENYHLSQGKGERVFKGARV